jgi:hypothetical protein
MNCMRCEGLMVEVLPLFWISPDCQLLPEKELQMPAWQCMNCGDYIDAVILANRCAPVPLPEELPEALVA